MILGGYALVYQFVHVGAYSILGFSSGVKQNVPPFSMVAGMPAKAAGLNMEGLRRHGFSSDEIAAIKQSFHHLYQENLLLSEAKEKINQLASHSDAARQIAKFLQDTGKRGLIR